MIKHILLSISAFALLSQGRLEADPFAFRTIALSETEGRFGPSLDNGDVFRGNFREPLINSEGVIAFPAYFNLAGSTEHEGLWVNSGVGNTPIAVTGRDGVLGPSLGDGIVFDRLWNSYPGDGGSVASLAYIRGAGVTSENRIVTVINDGTGNRVIARSGVSGDIGPGIDGAVYQYLQELRISPSGVILQKATLTGPSINGVNHTGIWTHSDRGRELVFRTGQSGPLGPGLGPESIFIDDNDSDPPLFAAETEEVILYAFAQRSEDSVRETGLWRNRRGVNIPLMVSNEFGNLGPGLGPDVGFVTTQGFAPDIQFDTNADGDVLFSAELTDGRNGFWKNYGNRNELVAITGEQGTFGPGLGRDSVFTNLNTFFPSPMITDERVALFTGVVDDGDGNIRNGLFVNDGDSNRPIALSGVDNELGPDEGSGEVFFRFNRAAMNEEGTVFFTANASPGVPRNRLIGLWAYEDGVITQLAKVGVPFDIDPSEGADFRTPRFVQMAHEQQVDSNGGVVNDRGEVVFYMGFDDGTYGVFTARVVPEPSTIVYALVSLVFSVHLRLRGACSQK